MKVLIAGVKAVEHMRPAGYLDEVLSAGTRGTSPEGEYVDIPDDDYVALVRKFSPGRLVCGPGCHLKRLLTWWGIRDDGTCGCDAYAAQMDADGPDGCAAREDDILAHLAEAAVRRGLPFVPPAARLLIRQAIANARKEAAHATPAPQEAAADVAGPGAG